MNRRDISTLRSQIDQLDRQILDLLGQRADLALGIADWKQEHGWSAYDPERERLILDDLVATNRSALPEAAIRHIFGEIISACRAVQEPTTVAFLGPVATFSHMAAVKYFGRSCNFLPRRSISDVFRDVEHGQSAFGVVPAENSNQGAVGLTLDEWVTSDLKICGEILLPVSHALLSRGKDLASIQQVLSHPQALAQCRAWLSRNLPGADLVETASTAAAAQQAVEEQSSAAIGCEMLADQYGLSMLARNIQDQALNLTRFFILGRLECPPGNRDKTSILFIAAHRPGALHEALSPLAEAGVNLTRIESRPTQNRPWEYVFFADLEGHQSSDRVCQALAALSQRVEHFKILGSYPAAEANNESESDCLDTVTISACTR